MRVLTIAAHPDDVEICCAATMALLTKAGHEVVLAHMTYGDKGGRGDSGMLARTRHAEAVEAAQLIGAQVVGRICGDLELYLSQEHEKALVDLLDQVAPDLVFTHRPDDYHPDHRITGQLALSATATAKPGTAVWFMDTIGGVDFTPTHFVDVGTAIEQKMDMIRCHRSQMSWMSQARHTDMPYMIEWNARWRGLQAGVTYAEGFIAATEDDWDIEGVASAPSVAKAEVR